MTKLQLILWLNGHRGLLKDEKYKKLVNMEEYAI
jgi:hypothetical protein